MRHDCAELSEAIDGVGNAGLVDPTSDVDAKALKATTAALKNAIEELKEISASVSSMCADTPVIW